MTSAIALPQGQLAIPIQQAQEDGSLFTLKNVITALFVVTITLLVSFLWGIPFGLVAGSTSLVLALSFQSLPEPLASLPQELHLDPAQEILPVYRDMRSTQVSEGLRDFMTALFEEIYRQSLHYDSLVNMPSFILDHFSGMDFSRLTLLGVKPIHFREGGEGYEIAVRSEEPQGWFHLCLHNRGSLLPCRGRDCSFVRIPQITPFLRGPRLGENHFGTLNLPFRVEHGQRHDISHFRRGRGPLFVDIYGRFRGIDLCQIELRSCRRVRFDLQQRQQEPSTPPVFHSYEGFEIDFYAPSPGLMRYYIDETGQHYAYASDRYSVEYNPQNIVALH